MGCLRAGKGGDVTAGSLHGGAGSAPFPVDGRRIAGKITRRQLERLFRLHLNDTPSNFYLGLRLEKARKLLRQTDMSVLEVSIACGFESPSYFTRSYRARFVRCPREDRRPAGGGRELA